MIRQQQMMLLLISIQKQKNVIFSINQIEMTNFDNNRITTIEHLLPSLEEINFQLTKTAIESKEIQSLTFSVSLEKISNEFIQNEQATPFTIQPHQVQFQKKTLVKQATKYGRKRVLSYKQKANKKKLKIEIPAVSELYREPCLKKNMGDLPTASTFFRVSPEKTKVKRPSGKKICFGKANKSKSIIQKPRKSAIRIRQSELAKYIPYLHKNEKCKIKNSAQFPKHQNLAQKGTQGKYSFRARSIIKLK